MWSCHFRAATSVTWWRRYQHEILWRIVWSNCPFHPKWPFVPAPPHELSPLFNSRGLFSGALMMQTLLLHLIPAAHSPRRWLWESGPLNRPRQKVWFTGPADVLPLLIYSLFFVLFSLKWPRQHRVHALWSNPLCQPLCVLTCTLKNKNNKSSNLAKSPQEKIMKHTHILDFSDMPMHETRVVHQKNNYIGCFWSTGLLRPICGIKLMLVGFMLN